MAKSSGAVSSSPIIRIITHLTVPEKPSDLNGFEFHESDVLFSSSDDISVVPSPSPPIQRQYNSGLNAALSDDQNNFIHRKPNFTPSQPAVTPARAVAPMSLRRTSEHYHQSAPVNVPVWPKNRLRNYLGQFDDVEDDDDNVYKDAGEDEMVPPHEIVARSYVTFSVFEGAGRTLKGRDLCRVRNAVFQKTGTMDPLTPNRVAFPGLAVEVSYRSCDVILQDKTWSKKIWRVGLQLKGSSMVQKDLAGCVAA